MREDHSKQPLIAVTTAVNSNPSLDSRAQDIALDLGGLYVARDSRSMQDLFNETGVERMIVVRRDRFHLEDRTGQQYEFHPNLATVRATNFIKHGSDHFLEALQLRRGEEVLDCTIGFGSEAILAAMAVGTEGEVVGLESVAELAIITREGMQNYTLLQKKLEAIMRRVVVLNRDYRDYLRFAPTNSYDVVYFDPFFVEPLESSAHTIGPLAAFGNRRPLDIPSVVEARRVCRRIVAIKHPKWMKLPDQIEDQVTDKVFGRRSAIAYSLITGFASAESYRHSARADFVPMS